MCAALDIQPIITLAYDLNDALDVAGVAHEFHCYDDAGHGFQDFMNEERYRQEASDDAWRKLMNYFDARLK